jgi:hypothetical protein
VLTLYGLESVRAGFSFLCVPLADWVGEFAINIFLYLYCRKEFWESNWYSIIIAAVYL